MRARINVTESPSSPDLESSKEKQPPSKEALPEAVKEEEPKEAPKEIIAEKKEGTPAAVSSSEGSRSEEESDEEDPNKLYCICRQPHDDR